LIGCKESFAKETKPVTTVAEHPAPYQIHKPRK